VYGYKTLQDRKCTKIIEGKIIARLPNMEKNCFLSSFAFILQKVTWKFGLTHKQYIELVFVVGLVRVENRKVWIY
jgi:hypothetical protein